MIERKKYVVIPVLALSATLVFGQDTSLSDLAGSLSADQIQSLQQLSPAEQAQLAEQAGISLPNVLDRSPTESVDESIEAPAAPVATEEFNRELFPGAERLPMFGYRVFNGSPTTFAPVENIPVPANYVLGPGDTVDLQLLRDRGGRYRLTINRNGQLEVPEIGPVAVAGLKFLEAKALLEETIATQLPGTRTNISLGALRSIQVFVLGEAGKPGAYTVSGLSTISNALLASGGISAMGSLRNIELRRAGALVTTLDLYDFLTRGDTSNDQRLLPGDVIFIPPVGSTVAVSGNVQRPAIYEIRDNTPIKELIALAGGMTINADPTRATLNRVSAESPLRYMQALDLSDPMSLNTVVKNGDLLRLDGILPVVRDQIEVVGHIFRGGFRPFTEGQRLTNILPNQVELKPFADVDYLVIRRIDPKTGDISLFSTSLRKAWEEPGGPADIMLQSSDQVLVFERDKPRGPNLDAALDAVEKQSTATRPYQYVRVLGNVKASGTYPYENGLTVKDAIIRLGGGLAERSYTLEAELIRYSVNDRQIREREIIPLRLDSLSNESDQPGVVIEPYTEIYVRAIPQWDTTATVTLEGEFLFPGVYSIEKDETLLSVIRRAGGFRDTAFLQGAFFSRAQLREREIEQAKRLEADIRRDLIAQQRELVANGDDQSLVQVQQLLSLSLQSAADNPALGRLTIDLPRLVASDDRSELNVILRPGDRLFIPPLSPEITVIGEVFVSASHLHERALTVDDYITYSGGLRRTADKSAIYLIRASGRAQPVSRWTSRGTRVEQGDSIIVPLKIPAVRSPLLDTLTQATQIIYQLAVGAAAVDSLSGN